VASAIFHLLLFFVAVLVIALNPERIPFVRPRPSVQPLEVQLLAPPPEIAKQIFTLKELQQRELIDSQGLAKADKAPDDPTFESDENMRAASEQPGKGDRPLPSIDGRTNLPFENFKTQDVHLGTKPVSDASDVALASKPAPAPVPKPARPPDPLFKPEPVPVAQPTPTPKLKAVVEPRPGEIALFSPKPATPQPNPRLTPASPTPSPIAPPNKPQPSSELAKLVTPAPKPPQPKMPGYQPQLEKTKIEGSISNRGKTSVDAVKTPLGVYKKQIGEAIGSRWTFYVKDQMANVLIGQASVNFFITKDGRVQNARVVSNTSNDSFARVCERSVIDAEFPPAPPEVFDVMKDGRLEITYTFYLYSNN
jgi:hypothetical protein